MLQVILLFDECDLKEFIIILDLANGNFIVFLLKFSLILDDEIKF